MDDDDHLLFSADRTIYGRGFAMKKLSQEQRNGLFLICGSVAVVAIVKLIVTGQLL